MTLGEDISQEYRNAEHLVREKMKENPELANSDTKLALRIIQDAAGIDLPISEDGIPAIGTITRASRVVRNEPEIAELVEDDTEKKRQQKEEATSDHFSNSDNRVIWEG